LYNIIKKTYPLIHIKEPEEQVKIMMSNEMIKYTTKYIYNAFMLRKAATYIYYSFHNTVESRNKIQQTLPAANMREQHVYGHCNVTKL
jgi:hypothetical protein